jgi:hypothetical protein
MYPFYPSITSTLKTATAMSAETLERFQQIMHIKPEGQSYISDMGHNNSRTKTHLLLSSDPA